LALSSNAWILNSTLYKFSKDSPTAEKRPRFARVVLGGVSIHKFSWAANFDIKGMYNNYCGYGTVLVNSGKLFFVQLLTQSTSYWLETRIGKVSGVVGRSVTLISFRRLAGWCTTNIFDILSLHVTM
jgi:hypothetical protein